jgi:protein-disulfide isomerase
MALSAGRLTVALNERDHLQGPPTAPLSLVEYGDYECPYCGRVRVIVKQVQGLLGGLLCIAFRNFPLNSVHPHAQDAAEAAEATGTQGKFWEMHALLFERQRALDRHHLVQYAAELDLDLFLFQRDVVEHRYAGRVREDFVSGVRSAVNGTPTFFINGVRYDGAHDLESLLSALEDAAKQRHDSAVGPHKSGM